MDYFYVYYTLWYNTIFTAHFLNHAFPTLLSSVTECWHSSAKWLTYFSSSAAAELGCAKHIRKTINSWKLLQISAKLLNKMNREEPISRPDCNHKTQKVHSNFRPDHLPELLTEGDYPAHRLLGDVWGINFNVGKSKSLSITTFQRLPAALQLPFLNACMAWL